VSYCACAHSRLPLDRGGARLTMGGDLISIVEVAYDLESDDRVWLAHLLEQAQPRLDRGFGVTISTYAPGVPPDESLSDVRGMPTQVQEALLRWAQAAPATFQAMNTPQGLGRCVTAGQQLGGSESDRKAFGEFICQYFAPLGVRDVFGVMALDPSGHAIWLGAPTGDIKRPSGRECAAWSRIAAHISAGARLRHAVRSTGADLATASDAVLSPSGAIEHAEPCAQSRSARDILRHAAGAIDRARSKARSDDDEALEIWKGLVAGRWSLVEQFDRDGRRFLVALKNEPDVKDPRALTLRERQVLAYTAAGDSLKLTAYTLGLSTTSVFRHRETAMRKLGLRSLADVVRFFADHAPAAARKVTQRADWQ
jgi:DNA-binding CsgD family transcriptional regulator